MNYQFTIQLTEEHIKYASRRFFFRKFGDNLLICCILGIIVLLLCFFNSHIDLLLKLTFGMLVFVIWVYASIYFRISKSRLANFKKEGGILNYDFSEEIFKVKTKSVYSEIKWEKFKALWIFPETWLLFVSKASYLTFPVDQTSNEIREFLKQKIISVGGIIK